ncbi:hypothetical protein KAR02_10650 [Candidatus Bipolaricaulota bacterium]|nr:hypothetical protein [Candidatus Bipolaricaulota bacterium]
MYRWMKKEVLITLLMLVCVPLIALADSETNLGITIEPPSTGGGAIIESTDIADLDLVVSPDNPLASSIITLLVHVDQAVTSISIGAEISNKASLKIKWYNLLENGHLLIGGSAGAPAAQGNSWQFGTIWQSTEEWVPIGDYEIEIPITLDLTAGGTVNPRNIPEGSTNDKATIIWTIIVGTL